MIEPINPTQVFQQRLAITLGIDKYSYIMSEYKSSDITTNETFQRTFNDFYMVRRNAEWREIYYALFERAKTSSPSFANIITELYSKTGNVEASFSSKMLATLNSDMPIWDQYVIKNLHIKLPTAADPERLQKTIDIYGGMCKWYAEFLETENAQECIAKFDEMLPDYTWFSKVKKIDFFLWSIR